MGDEPFANVGLMTTATPVATPPTSDDVAAAAQRLLGRVRQTPIWAIDPAELDLASDAPGLITFKLEQLQHSGTFKARGAANFLLTQPVGPVGVVAASGGNHGAAVAWAALSQGVEATIFVPTIASEAKVERLRSYGATVHQVGDVFAEAFEASEEFRAESGATAIHAYNDPVVMAGAGTTGLEFQSQLATLDQQLDTILVACGGGGLSGGISAAIGADTNVVVCETEGTATYAAARRVGKPVDVRISGLGADALGATQLGSNPWATLEQQGAQSCLVSDDELSQAQHLLWDRFRLLVEPAAATPLAVLLSGRYRPEAHEHVGILLCGGNLSVPLS